MQNQEVQIYQIGDGHLHPILIINKVEHHNHHQEIIMVPITSNNIHQYDDILNNSKEHKHRQQQQRRRRIIAIDKQKNIENAWKRNRNVLVLKKIV